MNDTVTSGAKHGTAELADQAEIGALYVLGQDTHFKVEWDVEAKVTPIGSLVFFAQYTQTGGLLKRLCDRSPLVYSSHNAPEARAVLGTILLADVLAQPSTVIACR